MLEIEMARTKSDFSTEPKYYGLPEEKDAAGALHWATLFIWRVAAKFHHSPQIQYVDATGSQLARCRQLPRITRRLIISVLNL